MWIKIFKTGTHKDMGGNVSTYSADDLEAIAQKYNAQPEEERRVAPHIIGHRPEQTARAFGWVEKLKREGDYLMAYTKEFSDEFVDLVKQGAFKFRSMAIDKDGLLRHVAWLGASQPAVAGLGEVHFAQGEEYTEFSEEVSADDYMNLSWWLSSRIKGIRRIMAGFRDFMIEQVGVEKADKIISPFDLELLDGEVPELTRKDPEVAEDSSLFTSQEEDMKNKRFAEGEGGEGEGTGAGAGTGTPSGEGSEAPTGLEAVQAKIDEINAQLQSVIEENTALKDQVKTLTEAKTQLEEETAKSEFGAYVEDLISAGKVLPAEKDAHVEQLMLMRTIGERQFADGTESAVDRYKKMLDARPAHNLFSEVAGRRGVITPAGTLDYGEGTTVDEDRADLHAKVTQYAKDNGLTYSDALAHIMTTTQEVK